MLHLFFMAARFYPYWAIPCFVIIAQFGVHYRRRASSLQYLFWGITGLMILCTIVWLIYRGDLNSDEWVRSMNQIK
jgi:NADH:ubiquinone oxidoreductase subunit 4 (subunit M)